MGKIIKNIRNKLGILGPGLITGIADDDPSGIATYSQTGAQFGFNQLWTALFMLPLQISVQEASARIGAVTGKGIAAVVREYYSKKLLYFMVLLVLIANTINIGADIGAMAEATRLIIPLNFTLLTLVFTVIILTLEIFTSYKVYAKILKWLCLSIFAYFITVFVVQQPWLTVLKATIIPHFEFNFQYLFIITGVLGTSISPYMFFWQASEEVEEEKSRKLIDWLGHPHIGRFFIRSLRIDNLVGMLFSQLGTWTIIVVTASVLNRNGITDIQTAADAAKALEPLVGSFPYAGLLAKGLFASGIIGLGFLAIPVLAGSAAYAVSEAFSWHEGLSLKLKKAHGFYGIITISTIIGLLINFVGIDPMRALVYTAVINGVVAVPLIFVIALITQNKKIMGKYQNGTISNIFIWLTCLIMAAAVLAMFVSFLWH